MTEQNGAVASKKQPELRLPSQVDPAIAEQLAEQARAERVDLVGPGGLLGELTKQVLEAGLEIEMEEHLGYEKHAVEGRDRANSRNGTRSKMLIIMRAPSLPPGIENSLTAEFGGSPSYTLALL